MLFDFFGDFAEKSVGKAAISWHNSVIECNQETFSFAPHFSRRVESAFTAGRVSSDGGVLLLREVAGKINLMERLVTCFSDLRSQVFIKHGLSEMLAQRIYGLALGYED
jgi:hypothetical protein